MRPTSTDKLSAIWISDGDEEYERNLKNLMKQKRKDYREKTKRKKITGVVIVDSRVMIKNIRDELIVVDAPVVTHASKKEYK